MKEIGTNDLGYPERRNFVEVPHSYKIVKEKDFFTFVLNFYFLLFRKVKPFFQFLHFNPFTNHRPKHYFNGISLTHPFVVTFETIVPRLGVTPLWVQKKGIKVLASDKCKKIIAISESAQKMQHAYLQKYFPEYLNPIENKMIVLHPPQKPLIRDMSEKKPAEGEIVFSMIGKDFFRKGGREVLEVFDELIPEYSHLRLNIVSELSYGDYASHTNQNDYQRALEIIQKHSKNITHYKRLPNNEVLDLLINTHVGLLPTWGETYGYTVLESQSAGCPVITTDIRALPEINDNSVGWIIEVPKTEDGNGLVNSEADRNIFANGIRRDLKKVILEIITFPRLIQTKGQLALERIRLKHSPENHARQLNQIYLYLFQ